MCILNTHSQALSQYQGDILGIIRHNKTRCIHFLRISFYYLKNY